MFTQITILILSRSNNSDMNHTAKLIALVLALAASPQPAFTQQQTAGHQIPFELVGVDTSKERALSLQEAVELALRNNRDIEVERINMEVSQFGLTGAQGQYDPVVSFGPSFLSRTIPVASILGGGPNASVSNDAYIWNAGLQQRFTSGANLAMFFDNSQR